jgi:hypothetical protein
MVQMIPKLARANSIRKREGYYSLLWKTSRFGYRQLRQKAALVAGTGEKKAARKAGRLRPYNSSSRPEYEFPVQQAGKLAEALGYNKISLIEFGVAGGNGLVSLEEIAESTEQILDVSFDIYGFDLGSGLPSPESYKDVPYIWNENFFEMDVELLQSKLNRAELILGDVEDTVEDFISEYNPAPIGAIAIDLDYYSSTRDALKILEVQDDHILPRVPIYFDDVLGGAGLCMGIPQQGEQLAIKEYNKTSERECIGKLQFSQNTDVPRPRRQYAYHRFGHRLYNRNIREEVPQIPLR